MNYKIGDLVTITGNSNGHDFSIGETVRLMEKHLNVPVWRAEYLDKHDWWNIYERDMKPATSQKIVITTDGKTTLARLYDGKTMTKRAEAKCAPSDTFDFNTGANLAFNRLAYGTDYNPQDVAIKPEAKPAEGEPVKLYCISSFSVSGKACLTRGKVYEFDGHRVNYDSLECFYAKDFEAWKNGDPHFAEHLVPLVHRPAKAGEWIYITKSGNPHARADQIYYVKHPEGLRRGDANIAPSEYLVLDGYKGDCS